MGLFPASLFAGTVREDSLLRVLASQPKDTMRVLTYNELFKATFTSEPIKALHYGQEALELSKNLGYYSGVARLSNNLGVWHSKRGNYDRSLEYYLQGREAYRALHDSVGVADCEMNIGSVHYKMGQYDLALMQYKSALSSYRDLRDTTRILSAVNNMGSVLKERGDYPAALQAYMAALQLRERQGDPMELGLSCANVGTIYQLEGMLETARTFFMRSLSLAQQANDEFGKVAALTSLAEIDIEEEHADLAEPMLETAIATARSIDDQHGLGYALLSRAKIYQVDQLPDSAASCFQEALAIFRNINRMPDVAVALNRIGELRLVGRDYPAAEKALLESLSLSDSLRSPDLSRDNHHLLSRLYAKTGDFESAFRHQTKFLILYDSLFSNEKAKQIAEMRERYESTQHLDEINRLNLQSAKDQLRIAESRSRNIIMLVVLLAMILVGTILVLRFQQVKRNRRKIDEKNAEIQQQRDLLESQNRQIREINVSLERMVEQRTEAMRLANQELDIFLYESAHALRRPLLRIQGLDDLLESEQDPLVKIRLRGQMRVVLAGMDDLLYKLIYVSEIGRRDLHFEPVALEQIVQDIVAKQPLSEVFQRKFSADFTFYSDIYLIHTLLSVIIENAFRFLDLGNRQQWVSVDARQDEAEVVLEISDNGTGIDPEVLPKVREMFFRGANHRGGNGLGLYIASKIVEKLHGTLEIQSGNPSGTRVIVTMPRHHI